MMGDGVVEERTLDDVAVQAVDDDSYVNRSHSLLCCFRDVKRFGWLCRRRREGRSSDDGRWGLILRKELWLFSCFCTSRRTILGWFRLGLRVWPVCKVGALLFRSKAHVDVRD